MATTSKTKRAPKRNTLIALGSALMVALVGYTLVLTKAAGFFANVDPSTATLSGNATLVSQTDGTQVLQFNTGTTPPPSGGCPAGQVGTPPTCLPAPPAPVANGKQWTVGFSEEFNSTDYDHTKLTPCFDWNYGDCTSSFNNGYEHYLPGQVRLSGGMAHLMAEPLSPPYTDNACYTGRCTYKAGLLSTARPSATNGSDYLYKFTYGYVEASLKPATQQGFFVAFWMIPADPTYNYNYEIDILEQLGIPHPSDMEMHYHYNGRNTSYTPNSGGTIGGINSNNGACPVMDYGQGMHRFGVDWEPTFVAFYIDGIKCGQFNGTVGGTIASTPMQLLIHQMVSNNWQRDAAVPLVDNTLSNDLPVDYIRVYQQR